MTAANVKHDTSVFEWTDHEFEIQCDIFALQILHAGMAPCKGDPAKWIAWRPNCCPQSPKYRLVCDHCKRVYQKWAAVKAAITCPVCGAETGGFIHFSEIKSGKS